MNRFEKNMTQVASKIRLTTIQKHQLRERLLSYMAYHPLPEALKAHPAAGFFSYAEFTFFIQSWRGRTGAVLAALVLAVGIPAVAERSVPGDILYPVKVRVNEEVLAQLSLSPYEKLEWETRRVERRIAEARLLAKEGKLTEEVEAQITETVKEHTASAEKELATLRESDADGAEVAQVVLESALDVQSAILADSASSSPASDVGGLVTAVEDAKATLVAGTKTSGSISSYNRFVTRIEESVSHAHERFSAVEPSMTDVERDQISSKLSTIGERLNAARELHEADTTRDAIRHLKLVLRDSQKVIAFITDIEVRQSVALENLVPETTIEEERIAHIEALRGVLQGTLASLASTTSSTVPQEETEATLLKGNEYLVSIEAALNEGVIADAEALEEEIRAFIESLTPPREGEVLGTTTDSGVPASE